MQCFLTKKAKNKTSFTCSASRGMAFQMRTQVVSGHCNNFTQSSTVTTGVKKAPRLYGALLGTQRS